MAVPCKAMLYCYRAGIQGNGLDSFDSGDTATDEKAGGVLLSKSIIIQRLLLTA